MADKPVLTIFAGINGAGKSTLYRFQKTTKRSDLGERICPDEILEDNGGDWTNLADVINSGKIAIRRIDDCIKNKKSFNWETTLISRMFYQIVQRAKEQGFTVNVNFIGVHDVKTSLKRIDKRIKKGGHGVPENIVKSRHRAQFDNIAEILELVDNAVFYDNSVVMQVVGTYHKGKLHIFNKAVKWTKIIQTQYEDYNKEKLDYMIECRYPKSGTFDNLNNPDSMYNDKDTQK